MQRFRRTSCWVFDLDNTLYPADCNLFAQMDRRMGEFVSRLLGVSIEAAHEVRRGYYHTYGTTLCGLMREHALEPDEFLDYVHDIDLSPVAESPRLAAALDALPGRKLIFTNGSRRHAENVAAKLGVLDRFEDIFDLGAARYVPKPQAAAYGAFMRAHGVRPADAAMFEDMPHNLEPAHGLGMSTVLVRPSLSDHPAHRAMADWRGLPAHIHHVTDDLTDFLDLVVASLGPARPAPVLT